MIRASLIRLIALVMLATIGLHAAPAAAVTIARDSGSAFDAATLDVATQPARRIAPAVEIALPVPPAPEPAVVFDGPAPMAEAPAPKPLPTGPPLHGIRAQPSSPRAPPIV